MGFFDGPLFDFNGNGKLDFHEFMTVSDMMQKQNEENEKQTSFNYNDVFGLNNNSDDSND